MEKYYQNETEFLKDYNVGDFKQLSMTTDICILSVSEESTNNYRKNNKKKMSVLLVKREDYPYKDKWCLPGGFVNPETETLEMCAKRILKQETNITDIYIEQLYTFDRIDRDPRCRVISTSYIALIDKNKLNIKLTPNASWFNIVSYEDNGNIISVILDNQKEQISFRITKTLRPLSKDRYDFSIKENSKLAFDHPLVIVSGIERIKNKLNYTDIVFNLMPEYFTLGELQQVYEVILGKKLLDPAFRRIIASKVEKTNKMKNGSGHRPSALYKYKKWNEVTMEEVIKRLTELKKTISTMESCTGGGIANAITNIEGASEVLKFSAVTYSNEFKIKMGVSKDIIDKYTVYSMPVANEMSKKISEYTNSDYGIGITGKLNRVDENNPYGEDNIVYISIYDASKDKFHNYTVEVTEKSRKENKQLIIDLITGELLKILER